LQKQCFHYFQICPGKKLFFSFEQHGMLLAGFVILAIVTGLIAGSYPAFLPLVFQAGKKC